jgi:hypothetical protein
MVEAADEAAARKAREAEADCTATEDVLVAERRRMERGAQQAALQAAKEVGDEIARSTRGPLASVQAELDGRTAEATTALAGVAALQQKAGEAEVTAARAAAELDRSYREALAAWIEGGAEERVPDDSEYDCAAEDGDVLGALDAAGHVASEAVTEEACGDLGEEGWRRASGEVGAKERLPAAGGCCSGLERGAGGAASESESVERFPFPVWARWVSSAVGEALAAARRSALEAERRRDEAQAEAEQAVREARRGVELAVAKLLEAGAARRAQVSAAAAMAVRRGIERARSETAGPARGTEARLRGSEKEAAAVGVLPRRIGEGCPGKQAPVLPAEKSVQAESREALPRVEQAVCDAASRAVRDAAASAALVAKRKVRSAAESGAGALWSRREELAGLQAASVAASAKLRAASSSAYQLQAVVECALAESLAVAALAERKDLRAGLQTVRDAGAKAALTSQEAVAALLAAVDTSTREVEAAQAGAVALQERAREAAAAAVRAAREGEAAAARATDAREAAEAAAREAGAAHDRAASAIKEAVEQAEAVLRQAAARAAAEAERRAEEQAASSTLEVVAAAEAAAARAQVALDCEPGPFHQAADKETLPSNGGQNGGRSSGQPCCQTHIRDQTGSCDTEQGGAATSALAISAARMAGKKAAQKARGISHAVARQAQAAAADAVHAGLLEVRTVGDSASSKAAAAASAWRVASAGHGAVQAEEADAALKEGVQRAECVLLATLGRGNEVYPAARAAAGRAVGRACIALFPDFFAPLWAAREEGQGPDPLGPLEILCVFCWEGFDWAGPQARRPMLTTCCSRRLCASCADARASAGGGCPFSHYGCAGQAGSPVWESCVPDKELSLRWSLARSLGFEFLADSAK